MKALSEKTLESVERLAREYATDVKVRAEAGDKHAEYHARTPKVKAYKFLLGAGLTTKEAVEMFRRMVNDYNVAKAYELTS